MHWSSSKADATRWRQSPIGEIAGDFAETWRAGDQSHGVIPTGTLFWLVAAANLAVARGGAQTTE
jgi:hypothetical protein